MFESGGSRDAEVITLPAARRSPAAASCDDSAVRTDLVAQIRAESVTIAAAEARRLRLVTQLAGWVTAEAVTALGSGPRVPGTPPDHEVIDVALEGELQAVLGIAAGPAARLVWLGQRLTRVLPATLNALEAGRLDLTRARVLADATGGLSTTDTRAVETELLEVAGDRPWDGLSPRSWKARVERTVVRIDADAVRRRHQEKRAERFVLARPTGFGMGELLVSGDATEVAMAHQVLTDLALRRPAKAADGTRMSMDQRRVDAFFAVFRNLRDGQPQPGIPVRRERELGVVLHADTFFGNGPAANDPGEVRGLGATAILDPVTAREHAQQTARELPVNVLLTNHQGALVRVLRLPRTPAGGWTRQVLEEAVRVQLRNLPPLVCDSYEPTVAIADHVRARNPRCTGYDCPRKASSCDLDHDTPWPRGPTAVTNLGPKCRRQHEIKTRGLLTTRLHPDGSVETTMLTGLVITTRPEPLPGHAPREGHGRTPTNAAA